MANILGVSGGFHDAALSVIDSAGNILFAGHSERYSKHKNDSNMSPDLVAEALTYGSVSDIAYYEDPLMKQMRNLYSGQGISFSELTTQQTVANLLGKDTVKEKNVQSFQHHKSHAAAGFQTSPFKSATVVVVDAIGEFDTTSIWSATYDNSGNAVYKKLWSQKYPHSLGLFYSAMTQRVGLRPLDEEYILMGMAAYGDPKTLKRDMQLSFVNTNKTGSFKENFHTGVDAVWLENASNFDIAAAAQSIAEDVIAGIMAKASSYGNANLVYMGGVALNCSANRLLGNYFKNIWIMPNPGDAGSSLGAAALLLKKKLNWQNAYLGTDISGAYPVDALVKELKENAIVGVASGRAEFGPRALGNRSLLADPRGPGVKDAVNAIKRRQQFRPFAPAILEEHVLTYFGMPDNFQTSRYMQVTAECKFPEQFPAIVHADGTSRVQTVPADGSGFRNLLEQWYKETGCPMLLNTSLNVRGEPMVNDRTDADRFEKLYQVKVCS